MNTHLKLSAKKQITVKYDSDQPIYGFQFKCTGFKLTGIQSKLNYTMYNNNIVFSLTTKNKPLPKGKNTLCTLNFKKPHRIVSIKNIIIAGKHGIVADISGQTFTMTPQHK